MADSMVQKWIKCCYDATICCTHHLKEDSVLFFPTPASQLAGHDDNGSHQRIKDTKKVKLKEKARKRSTEFVPPSPSPQSLSSWDLTSVIAGDEDLIATPYSIMTSAAESEDRPHSDKATQPPVTNGKSTLHCPRTWDGWTCWKDNVAVGVTVEQPCPDHIYWKIAAPPCRG